MPYTHKAFLWTAITSALAAVLSVGLAVGASLWLTVQVSHQSTQRICTAFEFFIHKPAPPIDNPLKKRQETQYQNLLIFVHKVGCK